MRVIAWIINTPLIPILISVVGIIFGLFVFSKPNLTIEIQKKFYEKIFGWDISKFALPDGDYWIVRTTDVDKKMMPKTKGAINGGLMKRKHPKQPFMNYISVDSIEKTLKK